jgi:ubiquinone/menaquinone biosynthesis C-methylase UbiE
MERSLKLETEKLIRSWMRHEPEHLGAYLVSGVEDPRINVQSIFTRHFLLRELFGDRFERLMFEECRFAAALNWLMTLGEELNDADLRAALLHALRQASDNAEGLIIPGFLSDAFRALPLPADSLCPIEVPNYVEQLLERPSDESQSSPDPQTLHTFVRLWRSVLQVLASNGSNRLLVLEPACGSANEYGFLDSAGVTRLIDYHGFDLCEKNVLNARKRFPNARFNEGNVFEIKAADKSFDLCFLHDLLEHLSVEGLRRAVDELCRVSRRAICIGFFQMHEGPDHVIREVDEYHWNTLSMQRLRTLFEERGFSAQVIHIATFLREKLACEYTHNRDAYTLVFSAAERSGDSSRG